tara:strand:- start:65 stop:643 length:579 start_codon:yes stop_codon:yes gene_type:complete
VDTEDDQDLMDTEDCEPVIRSVTQKRPRTLADRIGRPTKSRSALEVLQEKKVAQTTSKESVKKNAPKLGITQSKPTKTTSQRPDVEGAERLLQRALGAVQIQAFYTVSDALTVRTLWSSHKARAVSSGDAHLAVVADSVHHHIVSSEPLSLVGARLSFGGSTYAALIHLDSDTVLGLLQPADAYLAGLKSSD